VEGVFTLPRPFRACHPQNMSTDEKHNARYLFATRVATVAAVVAIVVCALLSYDYTQRLTKDPLDSPAYKALMAAVEHEPTSSDLKQQVRDLDLQLRHEYFRHRVFTAAGAGLLAIAVVTFLLSMRAAQTLRRKLPSPEMPAGPQDREAAWTSVARWAVAATGIVIVGVAAILAIYTRSPLQDDKELATLPSGTQEVEATPDPTPPPTDGKQRQPAIEAPPTTTEPPPTDAEVAKAWPRFRGPDGQGVSAYTNVPDAWDGPSGKNIVWKTAVPLPGNNSPVVWRDRVFLSGADKQQRKVFCFDAQSGKLLWQQPAPCTPQSSAKPPEVMEDTGYAAPTTATDGRRVFAIFANGDLAAFDFAGKLAWAKSLGIPKNTYGHASSLAMYKNRLLVQFDQGDAKRPSSKLLAFDSASGQLVWQVDRPVPNSWSSPIVVRLGDRDAIIASGDPWVIAYNATDGAEIWRVKCLKTDIGPSPCFADGRLFVANDNSVLSAIRADGRGDVTATHVLWTGEDGMPDTCSPLATRECVFLLTSTGTLTCYDAVKGGVLWSEEFEENCSASPSLVGNRLYVIARSGKGWAVEWDRTKCRRVSQFNLGEECVTSPAFQDGRIYLRGKDHLFCIGKK
jgi:outer membrane protein assembly factor BamB